MREQNDIPPEDRAVILIGDKTKPRVVCAACSAIRYCDWHTRSSFPPAAAERWLKKACEAKGCKGPWRYVAGFKYGLRVGTGAQP